MDGELSLPPGRYFSATGVLRPDRGGQTEAMLLRGRILGKARGAPVDVLTFDPSPNYDRYRAALRASGRLADDAQVLNLYEFYRDHDWGDEPAIGMTLPPLPHGTARRVWHEDGTPWKIEYLDAAGHKVMNDFQRRDGSVYLRASPYDTRDVAGWPQNIVRVGPDGQVLGRFTSLGQWYQRWLSDLAGGARTFVMIDSRYLVPLLAPHHDPALRLIYVLHNCHVRPPRRWDSSSPAAYEECFRRIGDLDAFVTLTKRQRDDIARAWGDRDLYAVVPHPIGEVSAPNPEPARDPRRIVMLARLGGQKRVEDALTILGAVLEKVPDARLDVYGEGPNRSELEGRIRADGLRRSVILHGRRPSAREELWTASALLVTSRYEAFPLVILESLSRGCPVVAYDVPYGPREQIDPGVNGYLVPDGDTAEAAARVAELLTDPTRVAELGRTARTTLDRYQIPAFVEAWARVLNGTLERSATRIAELGCDLDVGVAAKRSPSASVGATVSGRLRLQADNADVDPSTAVLTLVAINQLTGSFREQPTRYHVEGSSLVFVTDVATVDVPAARWWRGARSHLELRLSWYNAFWSTQIPLGRPPIAPIAWAARAAAGARASRLKSAVQRFLPVPRFRWKRLG